jgi:hypothetical protein
MLNAALLEASMAHLRKLCALISCISILGIPAWSATPAALGTVTSAERAHIGASAASVGTTIYGGDKLSTEQAGLLQVRTRAARFQLSPSSAAFLDEADGIPSATLQGGAAVFSTANSKAFVLHASIAEIRPQTDAPTVGQVSIVSPKELQVRSARGTLAVTVDGETQIIAEGSAYRVLLDPGANAAGEPAQGPRGAGTNGPGGPPLKAGRSRFVLIATIVTIGVTAIALDEALESPDRP